MMHMGNMTKDFVPVGKEEQAEIKNDANAVKVAQLAGIDCEWMITYFCSKYLSHFCCFDSNRNLYNLTI